jgi:hypothetical protein
VRESSSASASLVKTPGAVTDRRLPSTVLNASSCATGASLTGVTVIETVTVSEVAEPSSAR